MKYGNIHLLGILLGALYRYHPAFVVKVIDNVVESISFGLEQNDFRFFQRRVAEVKYLGELYNYRMLEHPVIFDTMYKILTFGYGKEIWAPCWDGIDANSQQVEHLFPEDSILLTLLTTSFAFAWSLLCLRPVGCFSTAAPLARSLITFSHSFRYMVIVD